jgi:hypothetical protein
MANPFARSRILLDMKTTLRIPTLLFSVALLTIPTWATSLPAQDTTAKQDMKNAGTNTKNAAKDAGNGVKKGTKRTYNKTKSDTKKAATKTKNTTKGAVDGAKSGAKQPD